MSTETLIPAAAPPVAALPTLPKATPSSWPTGDQHLVLSGVSWSQYVALGDIFLDRHIRFTYDRGNLEIMTLSRDHERIDRLLNQLTVMLFVETRTPFEIGGSMTLSREDLERGLEPDHCYWIEHYAQVLTRRKLDFRTDPPPDLATEVEVSRNVLNRLAIFAALRVPEVWRCDGVTLRVLLLGENGDYHESLNSRAIPYFRVAELMRFVEMIGSKNASEILVEFQQWVREQIAANWGRGTGS